MTREASKLETPPVAAEPAGELPPPPPPPAYGPALAAAIQLIDRLDDLDTALQRLVERAAEATGAARAMLWATDPPDASPTLVAWTAADGWQPDEGRLAPFIGVLTPTNALQDALPVATSPPPSAAAVTRWEAVLLGEGRVAACAATAEGIRRGVLVTVAPAAVVPGDEELAALAAFAALAGFVLSRRAERAAAARVEPFDPYLALPDEAAMVERLDAEIARVRRRDEPLALLVLELDRPDDYRDAAGAEAAGALPRRCTGLIRDSIRVYDVLGRGREGRWILLLARSEVGDALQAGERIRAALAQLAPGDEGIVLPDRITASGAVVAYPEDGGTAAALLAAAEGTLAEAGRLGGDQIRLRVPAEITPTTESPAPATGATVGARYLSDAFQALLDALTAAADRHDGAAPGHSQSVGRYARALAEAAGLGPDQAQAIELAGTLHDVGKIGLPRAILGKQQPLTEEERAILRAQPTVGKLVLAQLPALESVIPLVESVQEHYDGGGYPAGLRGTQIPLGARIIAIAEAYSAMISERPYRPALSRRTATGELRHQAGKRYDPELIALFVGLLPELADPQAGELEPAQGAPKRQERSPAGDGMAARAVSTAGAPDEAVAADAGVTVLGDPAYEPPIFPTRGPIVAPMASVAPLAGGTARPRRPLPTRSVKQPPPAEPAATRSVEQTTTGVLAAAGPSAQPAAAATAEPGAPPPVEAADAGGAETEPGVAAPQVAPGEGAWDATTLADADERDDDEGADGQVAHTHMIRREAERGDDEGADADGEGQPVESMRLEDTLIGPGSETDFFLRAAAERFKVRNTGYFYPWDVDE